MLPEHLRSTHQLVASTFPNGIDAASYVPLLKLLVEHMSTRNLVDVIFIYTGKELWIVYNDVLGASGAVVPDQDLDRVRTMLEANGFQRWISED
jgi:hypothetical protein